MKTWNLGNTTVRNPERIKAGLCLLKENFEGKAFDLNAQTEFFEILLSAGLIEGDPPQQKNRAASGRKWQSVSNKLGFVHRSTRINGIITITDAGNALLSDGVIESDLFLRQMLKVQLPSPTEQDFEGALIHPFYFVLSIAVALHRLGIRPLSKEELALFLQSANNDGQTGEIIELIKDYRTAKDSIPGRVEKRGYYLKQRAKRASELDLQERTLEAYGDTTARYSVITGIFSFGSRQSLVIKENQLNLASAIVDAGVPPLFEGPEFLEKFHNPSLPALPTDNTNFLESDILALTQRLNELSRQTGTELIGQPVIEGINILQLKRKREDLEEELITKKEIQFYRAQGQVDQIEDILSLFESIKAREIIGGSDYLPAWAEWGVWRVFLSINTIANPISSTRGFKINSELFPIHHAKGGAADLHFEYGDNTIIPAEITLNTGERQYAAEREPVRTHVFKIMEQNPSAEVIGIFVAPSIQPRTAHDFLTAHTAGDYSTLLGDVVYLNIVPLTIDQLCQLLPGQSRGCRNYDELRVRLNDLLALRPIASGGNGNQWLTNIAQYFRGASA